MTEREISPIIDKLREAERLVISAIMAADSQDAGSGALHDCKVLIWKAMDKAGDAAR